MYRKSETMESEHTRHGPEQRQRTDRRKRSTFWDSLRYGRRKGARREGEGQDTYVDQPTRHVTMLVSVILACSILDALLTLLYIQRGGGEANPIMALAIDSGMTTFVAIKMVLTAFGAIMLAIHQNFRLGSQGLYGMAFIYMALLFYHAILWTDQL